MAPRRDIIKLQREELNVGKIIGLVTSPECGAISNFIGITRDNFEDKKVLRLEYEAYEPMAVKQLKYICVRIRDQWNVQNIAIYHRLGEVPVSEASVVVCVSSAHRQESLKAVNYAIDALKGSVPIWKKEVYSTHEAQWKENPECAWSNINNTLEETKHNVIAIPTETVECTIEATNIQVDDGEEEEQEVEEIAIDSNLVQIRATPDELNNRIASFIERKRQQVNMVNVQEFCCHREQSDEDEDTCARVDAILIRRKDSKSHVKVHRVMNTWGPQTVDHFSNCTTSGTNVMTGNCTSVLEDRISTTERILGMNKPVPKDVYERLKNIENRILYLEGVSPEYRDFWKGEEMDSLKGTFKPVRKRTYSTAELDTKLHELENKYAKKMK